MKTVVFLEKDTTPIKKSKPLEKKYWSWSKHPGPWSSSVALDAGGKL